MGAIVFIAAGLFLLILSMMLVRGPGRAQRAWRKVAEELGLRCDEKALELTGELSGLPIEVKVVKTTEGSHTDFKVKCDADCPKDLILGKEGPLWTAASIGDAVNYESGDPWFDDQVNARGNTSFLAAILDSPTRRALVYVVSELGGLVCAQEIRARQADIVKDPAVLTAALRSMVRLANAVAIIEHEIPGRLSTIVRKDPIAAVRAQCIQHLGGQFPQSRHTKQALKIGRRDRDARVRLVAGKNGDAEGIKTLQLLTGDNQVRFELRAEALDFLASKLPTDQSGPILTGMLGNPLTTRVIGHLARMKYRPAAKVLAARIPDAESREVAATATALARLVGIKAEPTLLGLLEHDSVDVQRAAISALSLVAGPMGFNKLRRLAARKSTPSGLKKLMQDAVIRIDERLDPPAPEESEDAPKPADD